MAAAYSDNDGLTMKVIYTYQGRGEYIPGIPARDLSQADLDNLSEAQRTTVESSPHLYQAEKQPAKKKAKSK